MPTAVTCPKCRKAVSLPEETDSAFWVRCPLCLAKYPLQKAVEIEPPALEIIDAPPGSQLAEMMDEQDAAEQAEHVSVDSWFEEQPAEAPPISAAAVAAMSSSAGSSSASSGIIEIGEDDETLPAMEAGSLAPAGGPPDFHETHGFRAAPDEEDEEESGVLELQPEEDTSQWRAPAVVTGDSPVFSGAPSASAGKKVKGRRRGKSNRNPVVEAVKMVVGGGCGLAIGYAVLLWGFQKDPFKLAEILPPSIVPAGLQPANKVSHSSTASNNQAPPYNPDEPWGTPIAGGPPAIEPPSSPKTSNSESSSTEETSTDEMPLEEATSPSSADVPAPHIPAPGTSTPDVPTPNVPAPGDPVDEVPAANVPAPGLPDPGAPSPDPVPTKSTPEPMTQPQPAAEPTDHSAPRAAAATASTADSTPPDDAGFPPPPEPTSPKQEPPIGPKSDKKFTLNDVGPAMTAAHDAVRALESAPPDSPDADRKKLRAVYYKTLADVAETVTLLDEKPENAKAAQAAALVMLQNIATDEAKLKELGTLAGIWLSSSYRKGNGIVLAGTVQETSPLGKLFRTQVELLGGEKPSNVVVVTAEPPELKGIETALLLGTIVKDPANNLHDYEGTDETVIWASAIGPARLTPSSP